MAESSEVTAGTDILKTEYDNLRKDVIDTTLGHTHNGTDSKTLATDSVDTAQIKALAVETAKIANGAVDTTQLANGAVNTTQLAANAITTVKISTAVVTYTKLAYAAGDVALSAANTERTKVNDNTYTLVKEIEIDKGGTLRIKFDLMSNYTFTEPAFGRIYINGIAIGIERLTALVNTYVTYSEDISNIEERDLIQLYYKSAITGADTVYVRNFQLSKAVLDEITVNTD